MAKLSNRSPASGWWTITVLLLLLQSTVMVRPEYEEAEGKLRLGLRTPAGDNYLRVAGDGDGEGSSFTVAVFADLHFGEDAWTDWGPEQDRKSVNVMSTVLDIEKPDFVIYLGDVITANNLPIHNATMYWDQAVSPTRARNTPWASLFGNHDDAPFEWPIDWFSSSGIPQIQCPFVNSSRENECSFKGTTRLEIMRNEKKHNSLSYSGFGPKILWPSVSNYVITLSSSKNDPDSPIMFMYFLDSGGGSYPEVISNAQSEWFRNKSQEMNPDSSVPEIVFWHIPSKAYVKVAKKTTSTQTLCVGSMFDERVAPQEAEMGMMKFLRNRPSIKAVFAGHNHGLDWCCPYKKMWLCYARHTGYGGYGNWSRGARILEITEQPFSLKSWIRMEDGSSHSEVLLSS